MHRGPLIALALLTSLRPRDAAVPNAWAGFRLVRPVFQIAPSDPRVDGPPAGSFPCFPPA
jgi:hypothetical protein